MENLGDYDLPRYIPEWEEEDDGFEESMIEVWQ